MHSSIVISILGMAASASAHMRMQNPSGWFTNNSPLEANGSNFPCKNVDYNGQATMNTYQQGQTAPLTFVGQATHGGGSCQVVVTKDLAPSKSSVWKVIHSIEGGCPAMNTPGNMGGNAEAEDPFKYEFTVPKDLAAGKYTIAWTWFNKVGNREMYMECAPATVQGEGGDDSFFGTLPDMFVANIGNGCSTTEGKDIMFPNPGNSVQRLNGDIGENPDLEAVSCGGGAAPAAPLPSSPAGGNNGGNEGSAPVAAPEAPTTTPTTSPDTPTDGGSKGSDDKLPGGVFVTTPADTPAATEPATLPDASTPVDSESEGASSDSPAASAPTDAPAAPATPETPAPSAPETPSTDGAMTGPCTTEGTWNCIGGMSFQRCASGVWSAPMALAAGTKCSGTMSDNLSMVSKRGNLVRIGAKMRA